MNNFGRKVNSQSERGVSCLFVVYLSLIIMVLCIFLLVKLLTRNNSTSTANWQEVERKLRFVNSRYNASIYVIDLSEDVHSYPFFELSREAWLKLASNRVDYFAFFYKEPPFLVGNDYFFRALEALEESPLPGFGIALSTCGCVIPASILENLQVQMDGLECLALPGFVVDKELVVWFDSDGQEVASRRPSRYCQNPKYFNMRIFPLFDNALRQARNDFTNILGRLSRTV